MHTDSSHFIHEKHADFSVQDDIGASALVDVFFAKSISRMSRSL